MTLLQAAQEALHQAWEWFPDNIDGEYDEQKERLEQAETVIKGEEAI